ncbi:tetratricopeptide repeat protein [Streptomyces sp. NPDC050546]|uniref:tetratricopeptide repeat protein n=1 Tax=Streptomyces sp. NPDC050546 TaxID=3365628 RepID=UPI0037B2140F
MSRKIRKQGHWAEATVPQPRPTLWLSLCVIASVAVLCGVAAFWADFRNREGNPLLELLYHLRPFRFFILAAAFLIAVYCWRRFSMARKISAPGPISVPPLRDETTRQGMSTDRLTTYFRERLNEVNIQAPAPIPGGAQQIDFAEVLRSPTVDTRNVGASLAVNIGSLLAAGNISYAYQVNGALFNSEDGKRGVTVQVMVLPKWASQPISCTDETWELAIDKAAYEVCAFILPLTKLVDRPPWQAWRRLAIPGKLFKFVQQAQKCKVGRRFDEALGHYFEALKLDPRNPYLRLEVGLLQEQLGQHLDALVTYEGVIDLAPSNNDLKLYHAFTRKPVYFHRKGVPVGRGWWRVPLLMARYRQAILLGMGERLSDEWSPEYEVSGKREEECSIVRGRITEIFGGYFPAFQQYLCDQDGNPNEKDVMPSGQALPAELEEVLFDGSLRGDPKRLLLQQEFFQFLGQARAQRLSRAYFFPRVVPERKVPRAALRLLLLWNPVRRSWTRNLRLGKAPDSHGLKYLAAYRVINRPAIANKVWHEIRAFEFAHGSVKMYWPVDAHVASRRALFGRHGMRLSRLFPHWQDFYDVACIFAVCMPPADGRAPDEVPSVSLKKGEERGTDVKEAVKKAKKVTELADRAVKYLESSLRLQDSGFASSIRAWVLEDDPDLAALRRIPEFTRWANRHFPTRSPNRSRPDNVQEIELLYYEQRLIEGLASTAAAVWDYRSTRTYNGSLPQKRLDEWLEKEKEGWDLAADLLENRRHWQTRYKLIRAMRQFGHDSSMNDVTYEFVVPYPTYSDDPLIGRSVDGDSARTSGVAAAQKARNRRLKDLADVLGHRQDWWMGGSVSSLSEQDVSLLCARLATRWETLAKAFHEPTDHGDSEPIVQVQMVGRKPEAF